MKAGFIGLGHLGKAIAERRMSEGVDLIVWNRTREKAADVRAEVADSPADVTSKVETLSKGQIFSQEAFTRLRSQLSSPACACR